MNTSQLLSVNQGVHLYDGSPLCTRLARNRWGDVQRLSQCLHATNCYKL